MLLNAPGKGGGEEVPLSAGDSDLLLVFRKSRSRNASRPFEYATVLNSEAERNNYARVRVFLRTCVRACVRGWVRVFVRLSLKKTRRVVFQLNRPDSTQVARLLARVRAEFLSIRI